MNERAKDEMGLVKLTCGCCLAQVETAGGRQGSDSGVRKQLSDSSQSVCSIARYFIKLLKCLLLKKKSDLKISYGFIVKSHVIITSTDYGVLQNYKLIASILV